MYDWLPQWLGGHNLPQYESETKILSGFYSVQDWVEGIAAGGRVWQILIDQTILTRQ